MNLYFPASIVVTLTVFLLLASLLIPASYWIASGMTKRGAGRKFPLTDDDTNFENQRHIIPRRQMIMPDKRERRTMKTPIKYLCITAAVFVAGPIAWHFLATTSHGKEATGDEHAAAPVVASARVERGTLTRTVRLTAEFRSYQEIDVHAKVAGFIRSIPVDIGDRVKQGDVLAVLEVPELQEDLNKAQASVDAANENVNQADASYQGVHLDFTRLQAVVKEHPKLVAAQELDDARAKDQAADAALANARQRVVEAQAEQKRQLALVQYSKITAPFDGVVTKRYADVGALIQAGTSSSVPASAVVHFAQENVMRAIIPVPESAVSIIRDGAAVQLEISGLDGRTVEGTVTRFSRQLDAQTRTMETEVDVPNNGLSITPGMFGWAELTLDERKDVLNVPVQALSAGENPSLYVIDSADHLVQRTVKVGLQTPDRAEIVSGVREGDLVFIGNRGQVRVGESVQPKVLGRESTAYVAAN